MKRSDIPLYHSSEQLPDALHDAFTILFIRKGTVVLSMGEKRYSVSAPSVVCLNDSENPSLSDDASVEKVVFLPSFINSSFTAENIVNRGNLTLKSPDMDLYLLNPFLKREREELHSIQPGPESVKRVSDYFERIASELTEQRDKYWPCRSRGIFMELLFFIETQHSAAVQQDPLQVLQTNDPLVEQAIRYINTNYAEEISIDTLCRECAVNRTTLSKRFKAAVGTTIHTYIIQVRVQLAAMMLKETYMPVTEIMFNTGFNTTANFNRYFRKIRNCTPREYRARHRV